MMEMDLGSILGRATHRDLVAFIRQVAPEYDRSALAQQTVDELQILLLGLGPFITPAQLRAWTRYLDHGQQEAKRTMMVQEYEQRRGAERTQAEAADLARRKVEQEQLEEERRQARWQQVERERREIEQKRIEQKHQADKQRAIDAVQFQQLEKYLPKMVEKEQRLPDRLWRRRD